MGEKYAYPNSARFFQELISAQVAQSLQTKFSQALPDASLIPVGDGAGDNGCAGSLGWS